MKIHTVIYLELQSQLALNVCGLKRHAPILSACNILLKVLKMIFHKFMIYECLKLGWLNLNIKNDHHIIVFNKPCFDFNFFPCNTRKLSASFLNFFQTRLEIQQNWTTKVKVLINVKGDKSLIFWSLLWRIHITTQKTGSNYKSYSRILLKISQDFSYNYLN